jgi:hypothetical protein
LHSPLAHGADANNFRARVNVPKHNMTAKKSRRCRGVLKVDGITSRERTERRHRKRLCNHIETDLIATPTHFSHGEATAIHSNRRPLLRTMRPRAQIHAKSPDTLARF